MRSSSFILTENSGKVWKELLREAFLRRNEYGESTLSKKVMLEFQAEAGKHDQAVLTEGHLVKFMPSPRAVRNVTARDPGACWIVVDGLTWTMTTTEDGSVVVRHVASATKQHKIEPRKQLIRGLKVT